MKKPLDPLLVPILLILGFVLLSGGWGYWFYLNLRELEQLKLQRQQVQTELDRLKQLELRLPSLRERFAQAQLEWAHWEARLPMAEEMSAIVRSLDRRARYFGLELDRLTRNSAPSTIPGIAQITFPVSFNAKYADIYSFVRSLGKDTRFFTYSAPSVAFSEGKNVQVVFQISTYQLQTAPSTPTASPGPAAPSVPTQAPTPGPVAKP